VVARSEIARLSESVSSLANDLRRRADRLGRTDLSARITSEAERWADTTTSVAVIGSRGAGKTRLVAALTGRSDLPLAGPTQVPTIIRHGVHDLAQVCDIEGRVREHDPHGLQIDAQRTEYVELRINAPRMITGATLIDTPSPGTLADPRGNRTYLTTRRADHLVAVVDLAAPLSAPEVELIARCADRFASVTLVGTRIDRIRGWQRVLDDSVAAVTAMLPNCRVDSFGVSPVLADAAFDPTLEDAEAVELLTDSRLSAIQAHLTTVVERRRHTRLANFATLLNSIALELEREGRVVMQTTVDDTDDDIARLATLRQDLTRVRDDRSTWFAVLADAVATARDETARDLARGIAAVGKTYEDRVADWKGDAAQLLDDFDDDLQTEAAALAARIADRIEHVVDLMATSSAAEDLNIRIDSEQIERELASIDEPIDEVGRATESGQLRMRATGGLVGMATSTTMMMTALAGPGGSAALMRVGAFGAAALFSGVSTAITVAGGKRQRSRHQLQLAVKARLDGVRASSQGVLRRYFLTVQRSIETSLKDVVRERIAVLEREISELQTTARADAGERRRRATSLEEELRSVAELQRQSSELAARIEAGGQ